MRKAIWLFSLIFGLTMVMFITGAPVPAFADETTDEDQLFSGGETVVSHEQVTDDNVDKELKGKHLGFSGQIQANLGYMNYSSAYDISEQKSTIQDQLNNSIAADLFVDVRLSKGIKGFLSVGVNYFPGINDKVKSQLGIPPTSSVTDYTAIGIKEFFVDTNWKNKVYFRIGKQYLKWGQGYFWNPTDFINKDQKDFMNMNQVMAGTFGAKVHIPSGVKQNLYLFAAMNGINTVHDMSLSGKYEFLVKNTEMSFSTRINNGLKLDYGFDITGRVLKLDYRGELAFVNGENYNFIDENTLNIINKSGEFIPRASLGFTKFFTVGDIKDKISLTAEFYYNQAGYDPKIIERIATETDSNIKRNALQYYSGNLYKNSKYYMALFGSVQKFIVPEMTLNFNTMMNLVDNSAVVTAGIGYVPALTDLTINLSISGSLGAPNTEATFTGNRWSMNLGTKIVF